MGAASPAPVRDPQRAMVFPVVMTGLLFAAIHVNIYGFAFIFSAGCVLALIYYLTGSILCSMWAHLLYNGLQVIAAYAAHHNNAFAATMNSDHLPAIYPLAGAALFAACFYLLVRVQTPLPPDWSDNFRGEAPPEVQSEGEKLKIPERRFSVIPNFEL